MEGSPLADDVRSIRTANGEESIELYGGRRLRFLSRTAGSGRGFSGDCIILDEAYKLNGEQMAALMPTLSARPDPQLIYASMSGLADSDFLRRAHDRALVGAESLGWFEWSSPQGTDLDDEQAWQSVNPGMPHRVSIEAVRQERAALPDEDFARERLCVWENLGAQAPIDPDVWAALADAASRPSGKIALSVDVPPEGKRASIARAGERSDGRVHVEVDARDGTTWTVARLAELSKKRNAPVVLDGGSRAVSLVPALVEAGVKPVVYGTRQVVGACGDFVDKVDEDQLRHVGQPELSFAVSGARRRKVGDAWAWHRRDASVDITPLVAATLAVRGLSEEPPRRKTGRAMAV